MIPSGTDPTPQRRSLWPLILVGGLMMLAFGLFFQKFGGGEDLSGKITQTQARLRELHRAAALYQADVDGASTSGTAISLQLPPFAYVADQRGRFKDSSLVVPCAMGRKIPRNLSPRFVYWADEPLRLMRGHDPLFTSVTCMRDVSKALLPLEKKLGIGISVDGALLTVERDGNPNNSVWWHK